ncbi:MAG TPA: hypothetical protein VGF59_03870 [Bryobacteraceae bacterium]|jgi:uncharacterized protein (DUF1501 family)
MNRETVSYSRRSLLRIGSRSLALAVVAGGLRPLRADSGNRILVGIHLFNGIGGDDPVIPIDEYSAYARLRSRNVIPSDKLIPLGGDVRGGRFGLHPSLLEIRDLYDNGSAAVVGNVAWSESGAAPVGDLAYRSLRFLPNGYSTPAWASPAGTPVYVFRGGISLVTREAGPANESMRDALAQRAASVPLSTPFPPTFIGRQLRLAAGLIPAAAALGIRVPVLMAPVGGFVAGVQDLNARIYGDVSQALSAFYRATVELGIDRQVTVFTDSDSTRRFGAGQVVVGGSVLGGRTYSAGELNRNLRTTPYEQYAATLGYWSGLGLPELFQSLPGLATLSTPTLGFLE